jgi:hypothetical protein
MVLERDYTLQQGDTKRIVIPVFDSDDPDTTFFPNIDTTAVEFSIAESLDAATALWVAPDSQIGFVEFQNVKLGSGAFDFSGVDVGESFTLPDTQPVIVVTIPSDITGTFSADTDLRYQCRVDDGSNRLTPVKGSISVQGATPFTE